MLKFVSCMALACVLGCASALSGEITVTPEDEAAMAETLSKLGGLSGVQGGTAEDMDEFLKMVKTPEMTRLTKELSAKLASQGDVEAMSQEDVADFVRQNLTREDVEKLLGQKISEEDFQKAVAGALNKQEADTMLNALTGQQKVK